MRWYYLTLGALFLWRITHLLNAEDGPWDLFMRVRRLAGQGFWGELLDCFYCLSLWLAAPLAWFLGDRWTERLLLWPALSAGAIVLERVISQQEKETVHPPTYFEDPEDSDVLLRQKESTGDDDSSKPVHH